MNISEVKFDCRHFRGELPCTPNKLSGCICTDCTHYDKITKRILIIKLGAIGDVIRTTPLVEKFRTLYPGCHITWITHTPDILPKKEIDTILSFSFTSVYTLSHKHFDIAINLDKDQEACMLLADINAIEKFGFIWRDGHLNTANNLAEHKIITGLFDNESKINTKSYLILPKILASLLVIPCLITLSVALGIWGGRLAGHYTGLISTDVYDAGLRQNLNTFYINFALYKAYTFAFIISTISAYYGYYVKGGALEIGRSSTSAVVVSCILILISDYILALLLLG